MKFSKHKSTFTDVDAPVEVSAATHEQPNPARKAPVMRRC
jgi:hypothetical protein